VIRSFELELSGISAFQVDEFRVVIDLERFVTFLPQTVTKCKYLEPLCVKFK